MRASIASPYRLRATEWELFGKDDVCIRGGQEPPPLPPGLKYRIDLIEYIQPPAKRDIESWVFEPPEYDHKKTLFYIPGSGSQEFSREDSCSVSAYLCAHLNCRVVMIKHRCGVDINTNEKLQFPLPNNDIHQVINFHLDAMDVSTHQIYIGGYSSGGLLAIMTALEATWHKINIDWLILIAPAVNLSKDHSKRLFENDANFMKREFYEAFIDAYIPTKTSSAHAAALSPLALSPEDYEQFPNCTVIVGGRDALLLEIIQFVQSLPRESQHGFYVSRGENHALPWRDREFLRQLRAPDAKSDAAHKLHVSRFTEILRISTPGELNERLAEFDIPDWRSKPEVLRRFLPKIPDVTDCSAAAVSHFRYFAKIEAGAPVSTVSIHLPTLLRVCNSLTMYYLCTLRDTGIAEQTLVVAERALELLFKNAGEWAGFWDLVLLEQTTLLNHRALQAKFDCQVDAMGQFGKDSCDLAERHGLRGVGYSAALTFQADGYFYREKPDLEAAEPLYRESYRVKEGCEDRKPIHFSGPLEDLANVKREQGEYDEAFKGYSRVHALNVGEYGRLSDADGNPPRGVAFLNRRMGDIALLKRNYLLAMILYARSTFSDLPEEDAISTFLLQVSKWLLNTSNEKPNPAFLRTLDRHIAYGHSNRVLLFIRTALASDGAASGAGGATAAAAAGRVPMARL